MSENNPCFQRLFIALEILSPGISIESPVFNPAMLRRTFGSRYFTFFGKIFPITYVFGFA
jgi:hypothetical protein